MVLKMFVYRETVNYCCKLVAGLWLMYRNNLINLFDYKTIEESSLTQMSPSHVMLQPYGLSNDGPYLSRGVAALVG